MAKGSTMRVRCTLQIAIGTALVAASCLLAWAAPAFEPLHDGFDVAADQGHARAQFNVGNMYDIGQGVPENDAEAVKWYRKTAEQGNSDAQNILGIMYNNGNGVRQDYAEAVKWYRKAADQGDVEAQFSLGLMYDLGQGVPENDVQAYKWFNLAAAKGQAGAKESKAIVEKRMTREQIAEAQKLSAEWKPTK